MLTFFSAASALTLRTAAGRRLVAQPACAAARQLLSAGLLLPALFACGASGGADDSSGATGGGGGLAGATGGTFASGGAGSTPGGTGAGPGDIIVPPLTTGGTGGDENANPPAVILKELPAGFTPAEGAENGLDAADLRGGFQLVGPLADLGDASGAACANVLRVLVRDFTTFSHPDFGGLKPPGDATGLVAPTLDAGRKPVRTDALPTVAVQFEDWYTNVAETNTPYVVDLWLEPDSGAFVYDSSRFFPLDPATTDDDKQPDLDRVLRNFGFTTELHTAFEYKGGEVFTFRGDDDVFVFVDSQLVVDLGGVHGPVEGSVSIDSLGLTLGQVYTFDLFQAERNPTGSNFRLETTLDFTECGVILPEDIVH